MASVPGYAENNFWMNLLQIDSAIYGADREALMARLGKNGIQTRPVWALNHLQKPYKDCQSYKIERSNKLVENSLCLPSSTNLSDEDIEQLINILGSKAKN